MSNYDEYEHRGGQFIRSVLGGWSWLATEAGEGLSADAKGLLHRFQVRRQSALIQKLIPPVGGTTSVFES